MSTTEANLDDFFRKRDKKKKTKSTKFSKIDNAELASHLDAVNSNNLVLNEDDEQQQQLAQFDNDVPSIALATVVAKDESSSLTSNIISTNNKSNSNTNNNDDGDDEWKQFETDENRNYSGLKINFLRTNESDEENDVELSNEVEKKSNCPWLANSNKTNENDNNDNNDDDDNDDSNNNSNKENEEARTTKVTTTAATATTNNNIEASNKAQQASGLYVPIHLRKQQQNDKPPAAAPVSTPSGGGSGVYVPPSLRINNTSSSSAPSKDVYQATGGSRRGKNQPNINDEGEFPSLFDVKPSNDSNQKTNTNSNDSKFEQPKRSSKVDTHSNASNKIDIENRYDALSS